MNGISGQLRKTALELIKLGIHQVVKNIGGYQIWLSYNNQEEVLLLPVNPASIEINGGNDTSNYEISKLGQISTIHAPKLKKISFESEFPTGFRTYQSHFIIYSPKKYINTIESWMQKKKPIRLLVVGDIFDINIPVTISNFTYRQEAGHDCVYYKLELEEYKFYSARKVAKVKK